MYPLLNPGYAFHSHVNSKILLPESKSFISFLNHPKIVQKFPHNSINHFDTDFDVPSKSPLTITTNKLSDKLKKLKNPQITTISSSKTTKFHIELPPKKPTNHATFHTIPTSSKHFDLSNSL